MTNFRSAIIRNCSNVETPSRLCSSERNRTKCRVSCSTRVCSVSLCPPGITYCSTNFLSSPLNTLIVVFITTKTTRASIFFPFHDSLISRQWNSIKYSSVEFCTGTRKPIPIWQKKHQICPEKKGEKNQILWEKIQLTGKK